MEQVLSVPQLAARLGVSAARARFLVASGRIPAQQVAGRWIIQEKDADAFRRVSGGRPMGERTAWLFLRYATGQDVSGASDVDRHRLARRMERLRDADDAVGLLAAWLPNRAVTHRFMMFVEHPEGLRGDPRIRLSGISHPLSGLSADGEVEAYVSRGDLAALRRDWFLVDAPAGVREHVLLRVAAELPEVTPLLVAADLADRGGVRELDAAARIVSGLFRGGAHGKLPGSRLPCRGVMLGSRSS